MIQIALGICLTAFLVVNSTADNSITPTANTIYIDPFSQPTTQFYFVLFITKFLATLVMHLNIFPAFTNSMNIMKYVNNHPSRFDYQ